jgi:hypothetical protein
VSELYRFFEKYLNVNFHEHRSIGSRVVPGEPSDEKSDRQIDGRTDITKLIVASHNSANAPKKKPTFTHMIIKFASLLCFLVFITMLTKACCFPNMTHVNFLLSALFSDTFKLCSFLRLEDFFYKVCFAINCIRTVRKCKLTFCFNFLVFLTMH